jgi:hypothetical protein
LQVELLVEAEVAAALRADGGGIARIYAAGCAERMAQIFTGLRAHAPVRDPLRSGAGTTGRRTGEVKR